MILQSNNLIIRALEPNKDNKYPSIFFDAVLTTTIKDSAKSIINPDGCTNLNSEAGTLNIQTDWEHEGFYTKLNKTKIRNAGVLMAVRVEIVEGIKQLIGSFRVGKEHTLVDRDGKVYGSSYGSAWLMYATNQVNINGGSIDDYIPEYIKQEYTKENTIPIKSVSVEIDFGGYPEENYEDMNKVFHINKFDIISVGFLTHSPPGQSQSVIKQETVEIRSKSNYTNQTTNMQDSTKQIRCLCELAVGDLAIRDNQVYELLKSENQMYTIKNLETDEELTVAEADAGVYEAVEDVIETKDDTTRSLIRMCQKCQMQQSKDKDKTIKSTEQDSTTDSTTSEEDVTTEVVKEMQSEDKMANDITVALEKVASLEEALTNIQARLDAIESQTTTSTNEDTTMSKSIDTEATEEESETTEVRSFKPVAKQSHSALTIRVKEEKTTNQGKSALTITL